MAKIRAIDIGFDAIGQGYFCFDGELDYAGRSGSYRHT